MTDYDKAKLLIDELRTEVRNLRGAIDKQNAAIQAIASKVAEVRGQLEAVARGQRLG
jgi:prefoldin subunit 5